MKDLVKASWELDSWIQEGWDAINEAEKEEVKCRMDDLFSDGIPLEIKKDRLIYLYVFSMLSQLEVVAIQIPLKFLSAFKDKKLEKMMRRQLVDEVFHTMVFSKIAHALSTPYSLPPANSKSIEKICNLVLNEKDIKMTIILLNFVAEGWIEQVFDVLAKYKVAPSVFDVILEDERRHVEESELYSVLGVPNETLKDKLAEIESILINDVFFDGKNAVSLLNLIGAEGWKDLATQIDRRYRSQLKKINLVPTSSWKYFMSMHEAYTKVVLSTSPDDEEVPLTITRRLFMTTWSMPKDPTIHANFSLDVSKLDTFEHKYGPQTMTCLMLQVISKLTKENLILRHYLVNHRIYTAKENNVYLVVQLPGVLNNIALIKYTDPHEMNVEDLSKHIKNDIEIMNYCRYRADELRNQNPHLEKEFDELFVACDDDFYEKIFFNGPRVCLTNVGPWGYESANVPLSSIASMMFSLGKVDKKQVWDNCSKKFEVKDLVSVGMSVDHRVFDGNMGTSQRAQIAFDELFEKMETDNDSHQNRKKELTNKKLFIRLMEDFIEKETLLAFKFLTISAQIWLNGLEYKTLFSKEKMKLFETA